MKRVILFSILVIALLNCTDKKSNESKSKNSMEKDSLTMVIDSIKLANMHKNFEGRHHHGLATGKKNLAEHAHQNPTKKRRWRKKQFAGVKAKKEAFQRINKERAKQKSE